MAANGDLPGAIAVLESTVDEVDPVRLAWIHATLLIELARLRELAGDAAGARLDAQPRPPRSHGSTSSSTPRRRSCSTG